MFMYLCETEFILVIMAILVGVVFVINCLLREGYARLEKGSKSIINTEEKIIKLIRENYEDKCKNMENVNNVDRFVDKYVYNFKICGLKLLTLEKICGQLFMISIIYALFTCTLTVYAGCGQQQVLLTILISIVSCGIITIFGKNVDNFEKKNIIHIYIVDYLENSIRNKYQKFLFENLEKEIRNSSNDIKNRLYFNDNKEKKVNKDVYNSEEIASIIKHKERTSSLSSNNYIGRNNEKEKLNTDQFKDYDKKGTMDTKIQEDLFVKDNLEVVFSKEDKEDINYEKDETNKNTGERYNSVSENENTIVNEILKEFLA